MFARWSVVSFKAASLVCALLQNLWINLFFDFNQSELNNRKSQFDDEEVFIDNCTCILGTVPSMTFYCYQMIFERMSFDLLIDSYNFSFGFPKWFACSNLFILFIYLILYCTCIALVCCWHEHASFHFFIAFTYIQL